MDIPIHSMFALTAVKLWPTGSEKSGFSAKTPDGFELGSMLISCDETVGATKSSADSDEESRPTKKKKKASKTSED